MTKWTKRHIRAGTARRLLFTALRFTGVPFVLRQTVQRRRTTVLCYHDPRPMDFERQLVTLMRLYNVVSMRQFRDWRNGKATIPPRSVVITFDDGHRGNYSLRELFVTYGAPATIFLCSGIVGTRRGFWWKWAPEGLRDNFKYLPDIERQQRLAEYGYTECREYSVRQALSSQEIAELREVADLQCHSRFHPILPRCSDEKAKDEIEGSKTELESRYGLEIYAFAYPNGDWCERDARLVECAGYECAFTIDGGYNSRTTNSYRLHRMRMSDAGSVDEAIVKASGLWSLTERIRSRLRFRVRDAGRKAADAVGEGNPQWRI